MRQRPADDLTKVNFCICETFPVATPFAAKNAISDIFVATNFAAMSEHVRELGQFVLMSGSCLGSSEHLLHHTKIERQQRKA